MNDFSVEAITPGQVASLLVVIAIGFLWIVYAFQPYLPSDAERAVMEREDIA